MKQPICIYHGNCADGFGAAWVVWRYGLVSTEFFGANYGGPLPDIDDRDVLFVDFSVKRDAMEEILSKANTVTVLDHHKTAEDDLLPLFESGAIQGVFDMNRSGVMLAWDWFCPHKKPPRLLEHIQDRDLWRFELPNTREIQAALFSYPYDFEVWDELMLGDYCVRLTEEGKAIERKHHKDIAELADASSREMVIGGHKVAVVNLPYTMASDACHMLCEAGNPFGASYFDAKDGRLFSLRSVGDFDVSEIAKGYGGGGHKNAAGFKMPHGWGGEIEESNSSEGEK